MPQHWLQSQPHSLGPTPSFPPKNYSMLLINPNFLFPANYTSSRTLWKEQDSTWTFWGEHIFVLLRKKQGMDSPTGKNSYSRVPRLTLPPSCSSWQEKKQRGREEEAQWRKHLLCKHEDALRSPPRCKRPGLTAHSYDPSPGKPGPCCQTADKLQVPQETPSQKTRQMGKWVR